MLQDMSALQEFYQIGEFRKRMVSRSSAYNLKNKGQLEQFFQNKLDGYGNLLMANRYDSARRMGKGFVIEAMGLLIIRNKQTSIQMTRMFNEFEEWESRLLRCPPKYRVDTGESVAYFPNPEFTMLQNTALSRLEELVNLCTTSLAQVGLTPFQSFELRITGEVGKQELGFRKPSAPTKGRGGVSVLQPEKEDAPQVFSLRTGSEDNRERKNGQDTNGRY